MPPMVTLSAPFAERIEALALVDVIRVLMKPATTAVIADFLVVDPILIGIAVAFGADHHPFDGIDLIEASDAWSAASFCALCCSSCRSSMVEIESSHFMAHVPLSIFVTRTIEKEGAGPTVFELI